jgi:hypothetical protein
MAFGKFDIVNQRSTLEYVRALVDLPGGPADWAWTTVHLKENEHCGVSPTLLFQEGRPVILHTVDDKSNDTHDVIFNKAMVDDPTESRHWDDAGLSFGSPGFLEECVLSQLGDQRLNGCFVNSDEFGNKMYYFYQVQH